MVVKTGVQRVETMAVSWVALRAGQMAASWVDLTAETMVHWMDVN